MKIDSPILKVKEHTEPQVKLQSGWKEPKGCANCQYTGYSGRTGIYELISVSSALQEAVANQATTNQLRSIAQNQGYRTLLHDGLLKASAGVTSLEEVYRVVASENQA